MADSPLVLSAVDPDDLIIHRDIIPKSNRNRPETKLNPGLQWFLTQHTTGNRNDWATALMHRNFVHNGGGEEWVSFHLVVDDIQAFQLLPLDEAGYHAGDNMDNYWLDVGGYGSIAMELCVNYDQHDNPARWLKAKQNAVALWVAVLRGDARLDFGTGGPSRFSADRFAPHKRWSGKHCPTQLLDEGNIVDTSGAGPMKEAIKVGLEGVPPVSDSIYPVGMDRGVAEYLFGPQFNPDGPVSKLWIERGKRTGLWPRLEEVKEFDTRRYYRFSDGWTVLKAQGKPLMEVK